MHVAGADETPGEVVLEHIDHFFLHAVREASTRTEIGNLQFRQFVAAGVGRQPVELAIELLAGLFEDDLTVAKPVAHFANDRQQRDFEQNHMQPRATQADEQFAILDAGVDVTQVEPKQPEKAQEVWFQEADALEETQLIGAQAQLRQTLDLVTNLRQVRT
ncbi:hypothetical protein D3C84_972230 [compost metagenome]